MRPVYIVWCIFISVLIVGLIVLLFGAAYLIYDEVFEVRRRRKEREK